MDRRRLLRRAGTVAAGIASTGVAAAAAASPAQAAPGDPVLQGGDNDAELLATTLRSTSDNATLRLANRRLSDVGPIVMGHPALRLEPTQMLWDDAEIGSVSIDTGGTIELISREWDGQKLKEYLYTSRNSNTIVPIKPQRVVDTRSSALRARIVNRSGNLDSAGRVLAGRTIHISLVDFVYFGDATFGNVTVTGALNSGYLTVYPYGVARPTSSTINYLTMQTVANSFMTGIGETADYISVHTRSTTHLIIDLVSFVVGIGQVNPAIKQISPLGDLQRVVAVRHGKPSWL